MFGDLSKNNKGWEEVELSNVCSVIHRYPTFYGMDYIEEGTPVIRIGNILSDGILENNMENYVFVYDDVNKDFPLTTIELGDILMAVRGDGSAAKRIGLVTTEKLIGANISPNLLRIKAKENVVNNVYLFWYLISDVGQRRLDAYVNKTAKKNIAAKDIKKVVTPVPLIELQNQFADFVNQVDKLKFKMQRV
ncbi:restriction endonuclease [Clostridium carboxidivorans P7]|uniref:Restriction modification system DNA specificity domain protein n=1 Tax=Clostridium carboxidivorans P7 TaxID=536227 RepID=C6Q0B3_9CLOT|nr:restriction endonuclease subunit S [Clostridium carboxidivorans]AKN31535.1 restriction endonuclease [Clostridium carboxidivorans P7]EET85068.1 restriction modification system DNA specificity domain protein [Clostridium carboxidivorans P7]EFG87058.1 type I restriction modification DNA specificity domain protein [Clostridium carboxidivorans P7]